MKNIRILTLLFLIIHTTVYSQDVRKLTLEIRNLKDGTGFCGNVYLNTDDGISQRFRCNDGNAVVYFFEETIQIGHTSLTIRQDEDGVANVNMDCLLRSNATIKLPKMSVEVKEFKYVPMPTEISEALQLFPSRSVEPKLKLDLQEYESYFPKKVFRTGNNSTKYLSKWFSWHLQRMNEPVLCHKYPNDVYRFTWTSLSYFYEYDPYSVRIEVQEDGTAILFCSYYYNKDNKKNAACFDVISISSQSFEQFLQIINEIDLRDKTFTRDVENHSVFYSLESNINGQYHIIFRGDGEDEGMEELREFLWALTGLGENKIVHRRQRIE